MGELLQELRRRNVIRVAIAYAVAAWLLIQIADTVFPILSLPEWSVTLVAALIFIGFPIALIFAWAFELTPEGIKLEKHVVHEESITHLTGRKLDFVIIGLLVVALGYLSYDKFVLDPGRDAELVQATTAAATAQTAETGKSEIPDKSIAVLPFTNMSADPANEYFSDGLSEEVLNLLTKIPDLKVVARTSAFSFKGKDIEVTEIARQLRVAHVLEGSVRQSGDRLRVTAQLVDASNGYHLWANSWERPLTDVFIIQDEIATAVVKSLKVTVFAELPKAQRTDPEAYSLYLKSKVPRQLSTKEGFEESIRLLTQALAIDPDYADAWAWLATNQLDMAHRKDVTPEAGFERAKVSAQRALSIDPESTRAMTALGGVEMYWNWDFETAYEWFNTSGSLNGLALLYGYFGRTQESRKFLARLIDHDPLNISALGNLVIAIVEPNEFDAADAWPHIEAMERIEPRSDRTLALSGWLNYDIGDFEETLRYANQMVDSPGKMKLRACALHALARLEEAQTELDAMRQHDALMAFEIADVYGCWGDKDRAFEWLERAYEEHDPRLASLRVSDITFETLHDDPRWEALLQKLGLSDEHAEKLGL